MCLPPNTHLCSRITRTTLTLERRPLAFGTRDTGQPTTKAALTFNDCARLNIHPCPRIHVAYILTRRREGRAHIGLDGAHSAGSTHPCSRTHSSNAFPAEEKTALTFCALSNLFRPNTHRAAQEFGQFSSGWEPTGRRARASSLRTPVPAQEFGQFLTANPTQRRCIDANGNTRRPIPTQEFGQFFEERRGLTLATAHTDGL